MSLDPMAELRNRLEKVEALLRSRYLERSSVDSGRMRFIGGTLRVDSGGRVEIVGFLQVEGTTNIIGPVTISGALNITGTTSITGATTITGDVDVSGNFEVLGGGRIKVGDVVLTPGDGGRITIGTGSSQIIIDPAQLKVGPALRIDPGHSSTGAQVALGTSGGSNLYGDDSYVGLFRPASSASLVVGNSGLGDGVRLVAAAREIAVTSAGIFASVRGTGAAVSATIRPVVFNTDTGELLYQV